MPQLFLLMLCKITDAASAFSQFVTTQQHAITLFLFNPNKNLLFKIPISCNSCNCLQSTTVDGDGCGQERSPAAISITRIIKKPLTENNLLLYNIQMNRMLRVVLNVHVHVYFLKKSFIVLRFLGIYRTA